MADYIFAYSVVEVAEVYDAFVEDKNILSAHALLVKNEMLVADEEFLAETSVFFRL